MIGCNARYNSFINIANWYVIAILRRCFWNKKVISIWLRCIKNLAGVDALCCAGFAVLFNLNSCARLTLSITIGIALNSEIFAPFNHKHHLVLLFTNSSVPIKGLINFAEFGSSFINLHFS
jgi:hypothetical protein